MEVGESVGMIDKRGVAVVMPCIFVGCHALYFVVVRVEGQ